jgi:hypothetical protein
MLAVAGVAGIGQIIIVSVRMSYWDSLKKRPDTPLAILPNRQNR